ncbi:MAG: PD40 domain-containing protein [Anaerolineales bacterium]|nr:PD40 domain-containing protein [Anaerolineales bacterium]
MMNSSKSWILTIVTLIVLAACKPTEQISFSPTIEPTEQPISTATPSQTFTLSPAEVAQVTTFARRTEFAFMQVTVQTAFDLTSTVRAEQRQVMQATLDILALTPTTTQTPIPDPRSNLSPGLYIVYLADDEDIIYAASLDGEQKVPFIPGDNTSYTLSPNGDKLLLGDGNNVYLYDFFSRSIEELEIDSLNYDYAAFSWLPDNKQIIYTAKADPEDFSSIFITNTIDGTTFRLTPWETVETTPAWSPDNKWIVFASDQARIDLPGNYLGLTELYLSDANCLAEPNSCAGHARQLTYTGGEDDNHSPAWSPDSQNIIFTCGHLINDRYQHDICKVNVSGANFDRLTQSLEGDKYAPEWSPDGKTIAFTHFDFDGDHDYDVYIMSSGGEDIINFTNTPDQDEFFLFWMLIEE